MRFNNFRRACRRTFSDHPHIVFGALLPLLALGGIFGCLWLSVSYGTLPPVFPPLDGAVSVSRACREPPAIYLFRATVFPAAIFGALWWRIAAATAETQNARRVILILGIAGVAGFFVYALALGVPGARLVRRIAVYVFLSLTFAAQFMLARATAKQNPKTNATKKFFAATCAMPLICISLIPSGAMLLDDWDRAENFAEWHTLWLMLLWFPLAGRFLSPPARRV